MSLDPESPEDWERWLAGHPDQTEGVWLTVRKKGAKRPGVHYQDAVDAALCHGWIDSKVRALDEDSFIQWFSPRRAGSVWSRANRDRAERLISCGRMTAHGLAKIEEARADGRWDAAYTARDMPELPADLEAALRQRNGALEGFLAQPASVRLQSIFWVEAAKRQETRRRRIDETVENSIAGGQLTGGQVRRDREGGE